MNNNIAIKLENISKKYLLHPDKPTFIESINPLIKSQTFWALKNINLEILKGEHVGIMGSNGSGKTTLLRIIANITKPTSGKMITNGSVVSLIEISSGMQPDLTGIENIQLNGLLIGYPKHLLKKNLHKIISFADIGSFIYQPFYTYSDGMKLRISLAVLLQTNPDILILDESISVGDKNFQTKIHKKLIELKQKHTTVLMVSQSSLYLEQYCNRIITIHKGIAKIENSHYPQQLL